MQAGVGRGWMGDHLSLHPGADGHPLQVPDLNRTGRVYDRHALLDRVRSASHRAAGASASATGDQIGFILGSPVLLRRMCE